MIGVSDSGNHPAMQDPTITAEELARLMRREYARAADMAALLREKITAPIHGDPAAWLRAFRDEFERYRAHFIRQMALEEQRGYLLPVLDERPDLRPRVERLHREHQEITELLSRVYRDMAQLVPEQCIALGDCRSRVGHLMKAIAAHEHEENDLLAEVVSRDIGTSGH